MLKTFERILKTGWQSFLRNKWLSFTSVSVFVLTMFAFTSLALLNVASSVISKGLEDKIDISVFFKVDAPETEILLIKDKLTKLPDVKDVVYISRETALEKFKATHEENSVLLQSLEELGVNPLEGSLNIKAKKPDQYSGIANFLSGDEFSGYIDKVNYSQNKLLIERFTSISKTAKQWFLIITLVFALIAGLVAFNTVRLTLYAWRDEIAVMRLVGANNWYIRGPFLVEGVLYGVFASVITLILVSVALALLSAKISRYFPGVDLKLFLKQNFWQIFFFQLVIGVVLGAISSFIAIRRYLKV